MAESRRGEESRRHLRIYHVRPIVLWSNSLGPMDAKTVDVSFGGFGFTVDKELPVGDAVRTRIPFPNGNEYDVEGSIAYCRKGHPSHYGVRFSDTTRDMLLEKFLEGG